MRFIDEVEIKVGAGDGGNGCVAFRREKFLPLGGPSGGDGGKGGDVIFVTDSGLGTLMDLRYKRSVVAQKGQHGRGKDQYGKGGKDSTIRVPVGTQVFNAETGQLIIDLSTNGERFVVARGGQGGRGNMHFATPYNRAPRTAEPGVEGEQFSLRLELKLLADVGVVGFPNVGKSTFISTVSRAKPKIADYPFTTLTPNLGVVSLGDERSFVVADIPGLIEGASEGAGLGHRFLKHVERNRVLLHLVSVDPDPSRNPVKDYDALMHELKAFDEELSKRPMLVCLSRQDLPDVREAFVEFEAQMKERGHDKVLMFSSATREGLSEVLIVLERMLGALTQEDEPKEDEPKEDD